MPLLNLCLRKVLIHTYVTIVSYSQKCCSPHKMGCDYPLWREDMGPLRAGPYSPCEACFSPPVGQAICSIYDKAVFLKPVMV